MRNFEIPAFRVTSEYSSSELHTPFILVEKIGLEPIAFCVSGRRSNQLSYISILVLPVGLEPTNSEEVGFTVPCNCRYATTAFILSFLLDSNQRSSLCKRDALKPTKRRKDIKSIKRTFYLRPRLPIEPNFTNLVICNSLNYSIATHTELFIALNILLRSYRIRTCDLRLNAAALSTELTTVDIIIFCFSLCDPVETRTRNPLVKSQVL